MDMIMFAIFAIVTFPVAKVTLECNRNMGIVGLFLVAYWGFFIVRNLAIQLVVTLATCKPMNYHLYHAITRVIYMIIDFFAVGAAVIMGTKILTDNDAKICAAEDKEINRFRIVLLVNVIFGYGYLVLLFFGLCCVCCIACVVAGYSAE